MAGAFWRILSDDSWAQTVSSCSVTFPKNVACLSAEPVSARRIMWTYVSGLICLAREATSFRPSRS